MNEQDKRWTRDGHMLRYDGTYAIHVERVADDHHDAKLSPVQCDAISDYVCRMLNLTDLDVLTAAWVADDSQTDMPKLTAREHEVMMLLARGSTNREIADLLEISVKTVDTHRGHVLKKLALRNNSELTRHAIRRGHITP